MPCPGCGRDNPISTETCPACGRLLHVARLEVTAGEDLGLIHTFGRHPLTIGRLESCDLVLRDMSVSRVHARLTWDPRGCTVEDLGSRHGVFVDGQRIQKADLTSGSALAVGDVAMRFSLRENPTQDLRGSQSSLLLSVVEALNSTLVVDEVLDRVLDAGMRVLGAERGFVLLPDESVTDEGPQSLEGFAVRASRRNAAAEGDGLFGVSRSVLTRALETCETVATGNAAEDETMASHHTVTEMVLRTIVCLPMRSPRGGPAIGALYFDNQLTSPPFPEERLSAIGALARHAALAIENAQLFGNLQQTVAELRTARDEAMQAVTVKSRFLANMSHELHTPLNAIIGYAEIVEERAQDQSDDEGIADCRKILGAGRNLLGIVDDVLELTRLEDGKIRLEPRDIDLAILVRDLAEQAGPVAQSNGDALEVRMPDDPGHIHADETRVRQVLWKLLSNAAKFTERGSIRLEVLREGADVVFAVTDTGIGIAPEHRGRLFEPFMQADDSSTRRYGGAGLGLAVGRRLARAMGGELSFEAGSLGGSRFVLRLPAGGPA